MSHSVDCRIALLIVFGLVGGQEMNDTYDDDFITTSTDPPDDNIITSSSNPELIGAVIGAFLLLVITAGVILTIMKRRSMSSLHHRPATHYMMYDMAVTPKFAQTLKESMIGSRLSSSSKSMTPSRQIHVAPTRSMHIGWSVSEDHRRFVGLRSSVDLRSVRVQQKHAQTDEQDDSETTVPTYAPSYENKSIRNLSREILRPPSYDGAISKCEYNNVVPPSHFYNNPPPYHYNA